MYMYMVVCKWVYLCCMGASKLVSLYFLALVLVRCKTNKQTNKLLEWWVSKQWCKLVRNIRVSNGVNKLCLNIFDKILVIKHRMSAISWFSSLSFFLKLWVISFISIFLYAANQCMHGFSWMKCSCWSMGYSANVQTQNWFFIWR